MTKKILILSANPKNTDRLRLDEEEREIRDGLKRSKNRDQFEIFSSVAVRRRDLRRAMLEHEPEIVHFCGHGGVNGLMVEDDAGNAILIMPDALAGLFELFKDKIVCVLLNSCYSETQADAINNHIPYVIGMTQSIPDRAALEFAIGFYDALGAGKSIEEAFRFGRNAIQLYGISNHLNPVLKKRVNSILERRWEEGQNIEYMLKFAQNNAQPGNWAGLNRLEAEAGNLMWAVRKSYELKQWSKVLDFRRALGDFLYWRGFWDEAIQIGKWAFDSAERLGDHKERAWCALYPLTRVYFYRGNYDEAERWSERSLAIFKEQGDDYGMAAAFRYLGRTLQAKGDLDRAKDLFTEGLKKAKQFTVTDSHKNLQGHLLAALAGMDYQQGQYEVARCKYREALELYEETKDQPGIAEMFHRLGDIALRNGQDSQADEFLNKSLKVLENIHSEQMEGEVFYSLALLAEKRRDLKTAQEMLQLARERFQALGATDGLNRTERFLDRVSDAFAHLPKGE